MKITRLETDWLRVPLRRPVVSPLSQEPRPIQEVDVVLVHLVTDTGQQGLGLTYTVGTAGESLRLLIDQQIKPVLLGESAERIEWLYLRAAAELESVGFSGLARRAYAAVDFALWDLKGQKAGMPVYQLLGGYRSQLKAIVTDIATPALGAKQAVKEAKAALEMGAGGIQVEVGTQDPDMDVERLKQIREQLPDWCWFEISAAGRYDYSTALWMGRVFEEEFAADGFVEPLRSDDENGFARLSQRLELSITMGAYLDNTADFLRILQRGGLSALRIDPVRLGGITPARKIATLAELHHVAICPVKLPEIGVQLACSTVWGRVTEYVDWFTELFLYGPKYVSNQLMANDNPGLGLTLNESVVSRYRR